jgi:acyl-CoA thioesterase
MNDISITEEQKRRAAQTLHSNDVAKMIGMELFDIAPGEATITIKMRDQLRQPHGVLHGGITATLIDTAMAFAVITRLAEGEKATTVDLTVHYLRPHIEGAVSCTAKVVRAGKRIITLTAEAFNEEKKLIATAMSTYTKI